MCTRIYKIEKRILEITKLVSRDSVQRGLSGRGIVRHFIDDEMKSQDEPLLKEKTLLETERQFILGRRDNLFWKALWNVIVPILVTIMTMIVLSKFGLPSK
jgi:hypothetical protein